MKLCITLAIFLSNLCFSYSQNRVVGYYDNGNKKFEGFDVVQILDNTYVSYHKNGKIEEEGLFRECDYYNGNKHIITIRIDSLMEDGAVFDGKRHGRWKEYYESGVLRAVKSYACGEKEGMWMYFDGDGFLIQKDFYSRGNIIHTLEYDKVGNLILQKEYAEIDNENKLSKEIIYYPTGELKSIRYAKDGHYTIVKYWKNGLIKEEGFNGVYRCYDEDGKYSHSSIVETPQPLKEYKKILKDETDIKPII